MYLTYGMILGTGTSLAYNSSIVILGHYFKRRLGLVNGLVAAGSSVFTFTLPFFLEFLLGFGLQTTLQVLSGVIGLLMICALSFVPRLPLQGDNSGKSNETEGQVPRLLWEKYIDFSIWKNKKYVIWAIAVPIVMFGYFVPYVHLVSSTRF